MKKVLWISIPLFILGLLIAGSLICYIFAPQIISKILSNDFKIPISISDLKFEKGKLEAYEIKVSNLRKSHSLSALETQKLILRSTLKNIRAKTLLINSLELDDIDINIEYYNSSGTENNWADIMKVQTKKPKSKKQRPYLIKKLILKDLNVNLYKKDGTVKNYPEIKELKLYNISSESGFPIDQIEKAVFNAVIKSIFQRFNLKNLLDTVNPANIIPKVFKSIPFIGENQEEGNENSDDETEIGNADENTDSFIEMKNP